MLPNPVASADPYAPQPSIFDRHGNTLAAVAVFVLTAVLTVLSFPPFHTPEFAYAVLVPAIFWGYRRPGWKLYLGTLFAAEAVAWTVMLGWLHHVTWGGLLLLGPLVGVWVGVWFVAARWALPRMLGRPTLVRLLGLLGLAAAWVLIEWTRTWLLSGFPWLPLSVSQWERSSVLQIAAYTGGWGISFVLVAMNIGFSAMAHSLFMEGQGGINFRRPEFLLSLFLLMACVSIHVQETFNRARFSVPFVRVGFVQPYIPQEVKWDPAKGPGILDVLEKTTLRAAASRPDVLLWPEASTPWAVQGDESVQAFVTQLVQRAGAPLVLGSIGVLNAGEPGERWINGAFVVDPVTGLQTTSYAKRHLVPFGEYVPLRPVLGWLKKFVPIGDDFSAGDSASPLTISLPQGPLTVGPLVCYEDIFPDLARDSALAGAEALVVLTNNAWYGEGGAAPQHAAHSVLRAVETRRPVLRDGNGGWSGWIDEFGSVRATVLNDEGSVYFRGTQTVNVTRDVRWAGRNSFYVEHGDWFVAVCAIVALLAFGALKFAASKPIESGEAA